MEPIEDCERHGNVGNDGPRPDAIKIQLRGVGISSRSFKCVDGPHSKVAHQQECYLQIDPSFVNKVRKVIFGEYANYKNISGLMLNQNVSHVLVLMFWNII